MSNWGKGVINNIGWGQGANNDIGYGSIYADSNSGLTLLLKDNTAFIIEVDTTKAGTPSDQFQFTGAEGDYDVVAKQNNIVVATFDNLSGEETITLPSSGVYVLEVNAKEVSPFTGMRFNNAGDKLKITKNLQWGIFNDTRQQLFFGCSNLTEIGSDVNWLNNITNGNELFRDCSLVSLPETLTLDNLTNGENMFKFNSLTFLPSGMTLDNLTNGENMFRGNSLTSLPSGMTLPNLNDGRLMFTEALLTSLPSGMTLDNLINGENMFRNANLTDLPSGMTLPNLNDGIAFLVDSTINTARYSQLLVDMEDGNSNTNVLFHGGDSKYNTSGETARNLLIANQNWSFTDGGLA